MGQYAYALNYPGFKNHEFDSVAEKVKYTQNLGDIRFAAIQAQWVKARYVPVVELFASKGVKAYRTGWDDVINMDGYGTDNRYSFLLMNWIDGPGTSRTGPANTIVYGLSSMAPLDLNIVTSGNGWVELSVPQTAWWQLFSAKALSCIYDSLIGRSPYNMPSEVGWLATSWRTIGNYPAWSQGTVAEFTVRTDATFHDGSPVKPSDVAYSILLVRAAGFGNAWNYPSEMDVDHVEIAGNVVRVFFGVKSALTLHWAGFLPIINKDLWNQAIGVGTAAGYSGFIPDDIDGTYVPGTFASAAAMRNYHPWETTAYGDPAKIDLAEDGSGPWSFVSYMVGQSVALSAFTAYPSVVIYKDQALPIRQFVILAFHEIGNVNYEDGYGDTHDWYTHDEMIDYDDLARICTSAPSSSSWTWGPGQQQYNPDADLNKDGNVNVIDLATAGVNYGKIMG
jgi:ABC-type transport system substrate-binding protein